jgi:hypothetical protein
MLPRAARHDFANRGDADAKGVSKHFIACALGRTLLAYLADLCLRQVCQPIALPSRHPLRVSPCPRALPSRHPLWFRDGGMPVFAHHVPPIITGCAKKEVVRAHARRIIAGMADKQPRQDGPIGQLIGHPMRQRLCPILMERHIAIPITPASACPQPAPLSLFDVRPKTLDKGNPWALLLETLFRAIASFPAFFGGEGDRKRRVTPKAYAGNTLRLVIADPRAILAVSPGSLTRLHEKRACAPKTDAGNDGSVSQGPTCRRAILHFPGTDTIGVNEKRGRTYLADT